MRFIALPNNWDASRQGIAVGISGDPSNQHYKDQIEDWRTVNVKPFPFTASAVERAAKEVKTLLPLK
jgi:acyl-homoserine lactone acylase PvdQ